MGIISLLTFLNGGCFNILKNPKADPKTEFHNFSLTYDLIVQMYQKHTKKYLGISRDPRYK